MQQDQFLKDLLTSAVEKPPADFTSAVMARVSELHANKIDTTSLINKSWILIYKIAFAFILLTVFIVSFLVKPTDLPVINHIKLPVFSEYVSNNVIVCLVSFWIIVLANQRVGARYSEKASKTMKYSKNFM